VAVLGRVLISSGERLDLPDLLSVDSYTAGDFKFLLKGLVGEDTPYILKGFDIIDPENAIGTQSCSIRVADSVVFYPGSGAGSFYHGLEEGNTLSAPLVPELRKNAVNYIYLTFSTTNTSIDTRAFWDPDKDGGNGGEFTQDVNTESVLKVEVNVSVGSFPQNTIPIAKVTVGAVVISSIEDARTMLFRLGTGGINPNPFNTYAWRSLPATAYQRTEPPTKTTAGGVNPFQGADKNIYTLKEWMDVIMSKLREIGGTTYWYEDISTYSLISSFVDATSTAFKSKGKWLHDSSTPGLLTWTEDVHIKTTSDLRTYIVRSGSKTLTDEQVMYLPLTRNQPINTTDDVVDWVNGQACVNTIGGSVGLFSQLSKGDYVKKINDSNDKFLRVEEFYDSINLSGSTTTSSLAKSIRLSSNYLGTSGAEKGRYDKGIYAVSDVIVSDRNQTTISSVGGNFHWMAMRSDSIQNISSISTTYLSINIEEHDGATALVTSTSPHGLVDGDRITITGSANFNGTYTVEVETTTTLYIAKTGGTFADEYSRSAQYATVTTSARYTPYSLQLESANHGFKTNDTITVSGTTNYNGSYKISVRSDNTFTIPVPSYLSSESVGSATLAKTIVRTEGSVIQVVQGEGAAIGGDSVESIRQFVGMQSLTETNPSYAVPASYNTIDGFVNYNSSASENLTARVSKLTAMMADKAQDKTIKLMPSGYQSITNTTSGAYQQITFNALPSGTPRLDVVLPSSTNNGYALLSGNISLQTNQAAYIQIDRNAAFSYANLAAVTIANIKSVPLDENVLVLALRTTGTNVWLWDGLNVVAGATVPTLSYLDTIVRQNRTLKMIGNGQWQWNLATNTLSWSDDVYIQIPSLSDARNTIPAGSAVLSGNDIVAYVDINRSSGATTNLTVNTANISSLTLNDDRVIIARRYQDDVIVGSNSMRLVHGDLKGLDSDDKIVKVTVVDNINFALPTGTSITVDGISLANGDTVLFTKANKVCMLTGVGTSLTWTQLNSFNGATTPPEGALVFSKNGTSAYNTLWMRSGSAWRQVEHTQITKEPTGFPNRTDTTISFNNSTRTFTITPTGAFFEVYQKGKPYRFDSAQSKTITNTEGLHYIYFDNGILQSTQTFDIAIIKEYVFVATIQWDATNQVRIMFGDERHGLTMDGETHSYLHQSIGARYISGLSAGNFTTSGTGSSNSDAQLSIANGTVRDEDLSFDYTNSATPTQPFQQILSPIANIPMYYRSGASGNWRKDTATAYSLKQGTSRIKWNNPAGPWTTPDASSDDNYVAVWLFSSNSQEEPIIGIVGQREDTTLNNALANNTYESISFGSLPSLELKVLYRLIFQTSSAYTNAVKARLVDVRDLRRAVDVSLGAYAPSDHGLLTGLTDQDHPDYSIFVNSPSSYVGALKQIQVSDNNDVQKALNSLDRFFAQMRLAPHPSNGNRVIMSGADQALTNGITLTQNIKDLMISFDGAQIDFSTGAVYKADGLTALGVNFTPATITSNQYRWYSITGIASSINSDNTINLQLIVLPASGDGATPTAAPKAAYAKGIQIGSIVVRENGLGGITAITASSIRQLGIGGGGSSSDTGSGLGDDINTLRFKASFSDDFSDSPTSSSSAVNSSLTTASYNTANTLYRLSYDASRTVTGTGTSMTLSGTPSYTVVAGDMLVVGSEARRIVTVSTQTSYIIESAFSSNPSGAAACVSQAVHTNDVRAHNENSTGLALNSVITDSVNTFMLRYRDSAASGDTIWDFPSSALIAASASADNSNWTAPFTRVTSLSAQEPIRTVSVSGSQFRVRFFANAVSGTGAVNILDYKAYLHEDIGTVSGTTMDQAYCLTNGTGTSVNCSVSSATGKTRITTTWAYATSVNPGTQQGQIMVILDGKILPRYIDATLTPSGYYKEISGQVIELDSNYSSVALEIDIKKMVNAVDTTSQNSTNISYIQDMSTAGLQGFVDESSVLIASSTMTAGQLGGNGIFRSTITNRASIPDLANDLKVRIGVDRIITQGIYQIQNESGSNGEPVWGVLNDDRNLIRFIGGGWGSYVGTESASISNNNTANSSIEITFYGTGLNILMVRDVGQAPALSYQLDGQPQVSFLSGTFSQVINFKNYASNSIVSVVSNQTLGLHTVKINQTNTAYWEVYGFEVLNESANVNVRPGIAYGGGKKLISSSASSVAYNGGTFDSVTQDGVSTSFSTTRGARVLTYIKSDGTIGKSAYLTNASSLELTSANHTYEEVARTYYPREFGSGRTLDDSSNLLAFNNLFDTAGPRGFTLDDGVTTLVASKSIIATTGGVEVLRVGYQSTANDYVMFTFVGTGLDIMHVEASSQSSPDSYTYSIDSSSPQPLLTTGITTPTIQKIVSGLPYGTHTLIIKRSNTNPTYWDYGIVKFIVYQPKKPSIPAGAIELADHNIMANFAFAGAGQYTVSTGTLRRNNMREAIYSGSSWVLGTSYTSTWGTGIYTETNSQNAYIEYTFFGTGFDWKHITNTTQTSNCTVTLNGSPLNNTYPGAASITVRHAGNGGFSSSPTLSNSSALLSTLTSNILNKNGSLASASFGISGLPLGLYKLRFTQSAATSASTYMTSLYLDVITPIHSLRSNTNSSIQNALTVGNCSVSDSRLTSPIKTESPKKNINKAQGITGGLTLTTTANTYTAMTDMILTVKSEGSWFLVGYSVNMQMNGAYVGWTSIYLNGVIVQETEQRIYSITGEIPQSCYAPVYLPKGTHNLVLMWKINNGAGTLTSNFTNRVITAISI